MQSFHKYGSERLERGGPCSVETEVNGDTKSTKMKGVLSWLSCWACRAGTRDFCPALAALVGPVQTIFYSPVPIPQQAGQAVVEGRLSLNMCLWYGFMPKSNRFFSPDLGVN
jgi:hypothetical protein